MVQRVVEHGPIEVLEDNLWRVEGAVPNMSLRRVMTVARRADGDLVIHSAITLEEPAMARLEAWGRPAVLLVPNRHHRLDAPAYKARFPELRVLCPKAARAAVEQVVAVDGTYDDYVGDATLEVRTLAGTGDKEGVMLVRHGDRATLVINDVLFNMPHLRGGIGFLLRYVTLSSGGPRISRVARWLLVEDRRRLADELERWAQTPGLCRIIVSHHEVIDDAPAQVLREQAAKLRGG